ncbi:histidine phosphatase family protein [Flavobacteriaceae bacterium F89]|uniref:Histidine phosphatase family protein n=1 Tax=Cerina litoralis TaxID=2874477 RepID=A0AAE3JPT6_9FLAO|nr:phosphoglycerate mutase family protein [Cerina litoralis]MCG2461129.1 histidine phosphatase family protein [Cerina litoralis]
MKNLRILSVLLILLFVGGCKKDIKMPQSNLNDIVSTFYFIRHAEKDRTDPDNVDPELNQEGLGRAMGWAEVLDPVPLDAIYSTDFERTSMTAAPTSVKKDINIQYYDMANLKIDQFKADNLGKKVLIVGHSDTTPDFVNKMIGDNKYSSMDDADNSSLFIVEIVGDKATSMRLKIN